jgi:hypothetical protein
MLRHLPLGLVLLAAPALAAPPAPVTALAYHPSGKFLLAGIRGDVAGMGASLTNWSTNCSA